MVMLDGLDTDRVGNMRLARAGTADQNDVVGVVEEVAAMELLLSMEISGCAGSALTWPGG